MLATWLLLSLPFTTPVSGSPQEQDDSVLLVRAQRAIVAPGEVRENVAFLVREGVITAVGEGLEAPEGARVIEGAVVCPGFMNPWSSLAVVPDSVEDLRTTPASRTADALDATLMPHLETDALRGGVTTARVQAGMQAQEGGLGSLLRCGTSAGEVLPDLVLPEACFGASIGVSRGGRRSDIIDRYSEITRLVGKIAAGGKYRESHVEYRYELEEWEKAIAKKTEKLEKDFKKAKKKRDKEKKEAEEDGKEFKEERYKEDKKPKQPKFDEDDEAYARVFHGEVPLVVEVHRSEEIRELLEATESLSRVRLVIAGGTEALEHAEQLAARDIPVIVWPVPRSLTRGSEYKAHDLALAARLDEAGVDVLIGTGGRPESRDLRLLAAMAVGHGLDADKALAAITTLPARTFDCAGRLGALRRGAEADLVVLDGEPLESTSRVQYVVSGGEVVLEP